MLRWQLADPTVGDTYRLRRNPNAMTTPVRPHKTATMPRSPIDGRVRAIRSADPAHVWQFTGHLHSREEYDALLDWAGRGHIVITDHLGRQHEVIPMSFEPTPVQRSGMRNAYLFDYVFKALYMKRLA